MGFEVCPHRIGNRAAARDLTHSRKRVRIRAGRRARAGVRGRVMTLSARMSAMSHALMDAMTDTGGPPHASKNGLWTSRPRWRPT
jgi:hypothetical protein